MDIVYILGSGSFCGNKEIGYSIKSLKKHCLDLGKIYVIGEKPEGLPDIIHIPANDSFDKKWKNAYSKVKLACATSDISDEFLLMNDDFFFTRDFRASDWPFYALKGSNGGSCGTHSFHIHSAIRIKKDWYSKMPLDINSKGHQSPRTFYANFYKAPPTFCNDFIVRAGEGGRSPDEQIIGWPCFSVGDHSMLYQPFVDWLDSLYS